MEPMNDTARDDTARPALVGWVARTALLFVATYVAVTGAVLLAQARLPLEDRVLLEFFGVYASPEARIVAAQLLRGALAALILYAIYPYVTRHERAGLVLFGFFWGLVMLGSVEPLPGSIEGWIYTETPLRAHALIAVASAVHAAILAWSIPLVERWATSRLQAVSREGVRVPAVRALRLGRGAMLRFVTLHVGTYVLAGVVFMMLQDYATAFATQEQFAHFRPLDDPMMALAIPLQIPRGLLLGFCLAPFVRVAIGRRRGWLLLFSALFGATALVTAGLASTLVGVVTSDVDVAELGVGLPELVVQMGLFAWLFLAWERRSGRVRRRATVG